MNPRVMVYIPCHNYLQHAKECMDSIVNQTYPNQEIIVSFNGCTDGTDEFVKTEYPQVKILEYKEFKKVGNPGINTAIEMSGCEFYMQLGMDDKLSPNFWEEVLPLFEEGIGIVRVGCYQFNESIPHGSYWKPIPFNSPSELLEFNRIFVSSPVRKAVWESVEGGYNVDMPIFGDWDFWLQAILLHGWKWKTLNKPMFWYRRHEHSESYNYNYSVKGPIYSKMRDKWMWALRKYNILRSNMASISMIRGEMENEGSNPGWRQRN